MRGMISLLLLLSTTFSPLKAEDFPKIEGWTRSSEIRTHDPGNLWKYINGAAEQFLSYGFQDLRYCDLSSNDVTVTVQIYDMGTRLNAYGIYNSHRPDGAELLAIGAEAVISPPYQCLLLKDAYYVKVDVYEGEITETVGKTLLKAIADALPGADRFPEELDSLPPERKIVGSESFVREGYLGLSDLRNCVYARYIGKKKREYQIFLMIPERGKSVESIWKELSSRWKSKKHKKHSILYRSIPYKGLVGIVLTGKGIFGVSDSANEKEMLKRLEKVIKLLLR